MDNNVMFQITYGLFVLTAREGDKDNGCIINTAMQVTTVPNRIIVAVNKDNYTHEMIVRTGEFNVSILSQNSSFATFENFGYQSGRSIDKMVDISYRRSANGIAYLTDAVNGYISAKVVSTTDMGTHTLFLADVTDGEVLDTSQPVTYGYYQKNIKPAPNVQSMPQKGWICTICGFIYEEDDLPEDYICPICKHGAIDFRKL